MSSWALPGNSSERIKGHLRPVGNLARATRTDGVASMHHRYFQWGLGLDETHDSTDTGLVKDVLPEPAGRLLLLIPPVSDHGNLRHPRFRLLFRHKGRGRR